MTTYNATSLSQLKSYAEGANPGDIVILANGTYTGTVSLSNVEGSASQPITIKAQTTDAFTQRLVNGSASCVIDGGKGSTITNILNSVSVPMSVTNANSSVLKIATSSYVVIDGFEVRNEGRGIHVDRCDHITIKNCWAHRLWDRALGGTGNQMTIYRCLAEKAALENYNSRLFAETGSGGGWPGIVATYNSNGTHVNDFICEEVIVLDSWGEAIAPFHCDNALIKNCCVINGSHTVGIYLDQCRNATISGCFIMATNSPPLRHDGRQMHGILVAREGTSFPYASTGHDIYNNVIWGCASGIRGWNDLDNQMGIVIRFNTVIGCSDWGLDFEDFPSTPQIQVTRNIIEDIHIADTGGFSFDNNWMFGTTPSYSLASGGFNTPTPTFENAGEQTFSFTDSNFLNIFRNQYFCTNMVSSPFNHYGALLEAPPSSGGGGGEVETPVAIYGPNTMQRLWNSRYSFGVAGYR